MKLWLLLLIGTFSSAGAAGLPEGVTNTQRWQDKPLSPAEALKRITVPSGFRVDLFAAEPDVLQPIAFDFDDRGRLWVVECFSYPDFKQQDRDRVLIFSDNDGDGKYDERKVFLADGHRLSGIALGFGGVWLCSAPNLIFIPDTNGDAIPDARAILQLDGFSTKAEHNMVNGLAWGPDGWLYGRHGILRDSQVGRPGTPEKDRVLLNCSIWRYHPTRKVAEVVAHGTTNPWGLDWDEHGQPFFSNNVIGHMWHLVYGAHYQRMYGEDFNPHYYELMKATSDHLHWGGEDWRKARGGQEHNQLGGGHSHCGLMIYQGGAWPEDYRQTLMTANTHGQRLLFDRIARHGSGYVAKHGDNFFMANDAWFRSTMVGYGPDGGVFVSDWNDLGECHDADGVHRTSGRIYKVTYGAPVPPRAFDLSKLSDKELVNLQLHKNEWFVRHARRLLQERFAAGKLHAQARPELRRMLTDHPDITRKLRALWALHVTAGTDDAMWRELLRHENEHLRWWALKLMADDGAPKLKAELERLARSEPTAFVRLGVASAMQRLKPAERLEIAGALSERAEDSADPSIPLMIWYALEPAVANDPQAGAELLVRCRIPQLRQFIARRLTAAYQLSRN
jgi:putative membrane-bound dehydrogenase-like protein